jgi:hypothetical protein
MVVLRAVPPAAGPGSRSGPWSRLGQGEAGEDLRGHEGGHLVHRDAVEDEHLECLGDVALLVRVPAAAGIRGRAVRACWQGSVGWLGSPNPTAIGKSLDLEQVLVLGAGKLSLVR